ncbi:hypothetical protein [Telmatospirillum sp.]|uniref:hypothetical protein n=1 Tax=Telmatospirillum sp. TaxID=2079197 RepID=UPI00284DD9A1|nr:hypothetical protein [Telmatospirillum sp.]MDR3440979.1 hypothetical protein [Telmatospirillum sp.]
MMHISMPLAALAFLAFSYTGAAADQPMTLDSYRVKAALPAICNQIGGKLTYGVNSVQCQPTQVTAKKPTSATSVGRPDPVTTRR